MSVHVSWMVAQEFIESAVGAVNASMNPLKVVTQKHLRLVMIQGALEVDRQKAPPDARGHRVIVTPLLHHPDDVIVARLKKNSCNRFFIKLFFLLSI